MPRKYYRYLLYALEIFLLFVIEGTVHLIPQIYLVKPLLLISAAISIAAFELPYCSLFFGVLCGLIIDAGTGGVMGLTSVILGGICFCESSWNNKYIKNNIYFALMYSAVACAAVISLKFFIFYYIPQYEGRIDFYLSHYLPRIVYSWAVTPIVYVVTLGISHTFRKEKKKIRVRRRKRVPRSQRSGASKRRAKLSQ